MHKKATIWEKFNQVPEEVSHFYKWELNSVQTIIIPSNSVGEGRDPH